MHRPWFPIAPYNLRLTTTPWHPQPKDKPATHPWMRTCPPKQGKRLLYPRWHRPDTAGPGRRLQAAALPVAVKHRQQLRTNRLNAKPLTAHENGLTPKRSCVDSMGKGGWNWPSAAVEDERLSGKARTVQNHLQQQWFPTPGQKMRHGLQSKLAECPGAETKHRSTQGWFILARWP